MVDFMPRPNRSRPTATINRRKRPPVAFRVAVWPGDVPPERRDGETLNDAAIFRDPADVLEYQRLILAVGGKVHRVAKIVAPDFWYDSIDDFFRQQHPQQPGTVP